MTPEELFECVRTNQIQHGSHESDLYIPCNEQTEALIGVYDFKANVTRFKSNIDGKIWFDVPFAYIPYWTARSKVIT